MAEWPRFKSARIVQAMKIKAITTPPDAAQGAVVYPVITTEDGHPFTPTEPGMTLRCAVGDYAMAYEDGFRSVCPAKSFEDNYTAI